MKKIAVVGTGYVGLVTGTCFAETGNQVLCVDIDENKVNRMRNGEVPIYEPHLDVIFERNIKDKRIRFTTDLKEAVDFAEIIFLALPTPPGEDGSADLSYVLGVAEQLGKLMTEYKVIVDKSTVPVGTSEKVHEAIEKYASVEFSVVSNPEFLREGFAVDDFLNPDRVVVGTSDSRASKIMTELYKPFIHDGHPLIIMDEKSAELTKYAANAFLATKITFMNEIANFCEAVDFAEIIFLALPTPPGEDGSADLSYVLGVAEQLGKLMTEYKVIVDKSTVPVGTSEKVHDAIEKYASVEFSVVSNPEFLREGFAVDDFLNPDRVVVGTSDSRASKIMTELYKPFIHDGHPLIIMDEKSAELTKYAANAFLATKITFMNEIANFCEAVGADVDKVRLGIGSDSRIGHKFLYPGIGFGGSCFPKDVTALLKSGKQVGYNFEIIQSVLDVNEKQKTTIVHKIKSFYGDIKGLKFAIWGLAFKPDTDDIREASALYIIKDLIELGAEIEVYDPEAMPNVKDLLGDKISYASNQYDALLNKDALIIATEWSAFRNPDFDLLKENLNQPIIFDGRNIYELDQMENLGFYYNSVGRKTILPFVKIENK